MAVWLGPAGFGLMGLYSSITDLAQSIAGMGINASGVRQIAEAVGAGDTERIAGTVVVLRRTAVVLGILGAAVLIAFPRAVSMLTFGNDQHATTVKLLSATVLFSCLSGGQAALIQGIQRISDLVKMGIPGCSLARDHQHSDRVCSPRGRDRTVAHMRCCHLVARFLVVYQKDKDPDAVDGARPNRA